MFHAKYGFYIRWTRGIITWELLNLVCKLQSKLSTAFWNVNDNFSSIEVPIWWTKRTEPKNNNIRSIKMF